MDADVLVKGGKVVAPDAVLEGADVLVRRGRIEAVGTAKVKGQIETVDASGLFVWPGLVDIHIHGARGEMIPIGGDRAFEAVSLALASEGVTRFLASVPPMPPQELEKHVALAAKSCGLPLPGAACLGIHLEGPFLHPQRSGALMPQGVRPPDPAEFRKLVVAAAGKLRVMTVAPELPGAAAILEEAKGLGIVTAIGHTEASFAEVEESLRRGLSHVTHCFNAMRGMSHRAPGPAEAALTLDGLSVELICDGHHVHRALMDILFRCRGTSAVCLVSDSTALQAPEGKVTIMGRTLEVRRGLVRDSETGMLGGSAISLWDAVKNLRGWFGFQPPVLARMAALNPAKVAGVARDLGTIEQGKLADLVLADAEYRVRSVYREGRRVWAAEESR